MNIPSNSFTSISSSPHRVWCTDSPHLKKSDIRIDNGDIYLEKCDIKHNTLVNAKSAIAWGYTSYEHVLSPRATSTCTRPTVYYSTEGDEEEQQLSTMCQHQQHKRETQETELTLEQAQSDVLNENIGTASCFDSFLRACDAIATVIMEEVDTNDDENETCTRGNNISMRSNNVIGRKITLV